MGQGTWGMDPGDDGAEEDMRRYDIERMRRMREEQRKFKFAVAEEVKKQLAASGVLRAAVQKQKPRGRMVDKICKCGCGVKFKARDADIKRGWGLFSSKSCAAKYKDVKSRGVHRDYYGT